MCEINTNIRIYKHLNGDATILCSGCGRAIKSKRTFTPLEIAAIKDQSILPSQFCKDCHPIKVKIVRSRDNAWYKDAIGEEYIVVKYAWNLILGSSHYKVVGFNGLIAIKDVEITV